MGLAMSRLPVDPIFLTKKRVLPVYGRKCARRGTDETVTTGLSAGLHKRNYSHLLVIEEIGYILYNMAL